MSLSNCLAIEKPNQYAHWLVHHYKEFPYNVGTFSIASIIILSVPGALKIPSWEMRQLAYQSNPCILLLIA